MLGWLTIYSIIAHWMVVTEEEHLSQIFGEEYTTYCTSVPRYVPRL
jgi:protein-S-isoprenylcysteine O-methyltransferase Ste14